MTDPIRVRNVGRRIATDGGVESERFGMLAEELTDAILVIDADSTIRYANPAVSDVFGYEPDELVGESVTKLMSPAVAERHLDGMERYLGEGERHVDWSYVELTGERRDGSDVPLGISFSEFTTGDERLFTGIVRDVSEQKCRESELHDRVRQQEALSTFSRHALEDRPVADLMDEAVELVADALDREYAEVLEYRPERDDLVVRSVFGWSEDLVGVTIGTDRDSQVGYTLLTEEPVVAEDLTVEDRFSRDEILESGGVVSGVSAIIGSPSDPWGVLGCHAPERETYTDYDVQFVQSVANVLTTIIRRRERGETLERYAAMLDAVDDGVYALDADSRFVAVNDAYLELTGYDRDELLGERAETILGSDLYEEVRWMRGTLEDGESAVSTEVSLPTADGGSVPVEARVAPLPLGDEMGRVGVVRDVSDRKRREETLTSLNELFRSLADAEHREEICDLAVDAAVETLQFPNATVALYDDERSGLVTAVRRWSGDEVDDVLVSERGVDVTWQTFVDGEARTFDDLRSELDADAEMRSALTIPLGKHGVFVAASPERAAFDATDESLADVLCSNVRSALDRAEREDTLREQRNDLQEKNRELERTNRLNLFIRESTKALIRASSRDDVMQAVCDRLTDVGPYRFAWFGTHDRATGDVHAEAWAGVENGYLYQIRVGAGGNEVSGEGPAGEALRTKELQVQNDLLGDPPFATWREAALKRGYQSCASVPVVYDERLWGVLAIYADEPGAFEETEREVLSELGETIGYALNALEREQALVGERSIELDFRISGTGNPVLAFVAQTGAEFEFENAVSSADGRLHVFFTVRDASPEETLEFVEDVSWIEDVRLVAERDGEYLYECVLAEESFLKSLVTRGAMPQSITATADGGRFVLRIPQNADVRPFVDRFEDYYDEAELVARRERDEPVLTRHDFEAELDERLTDRQWEVLRTAYFSGFFEWPRESTAEEIAEALGVSQPTVSRHVRAGERALFGLLFENS